MKTFTELFLRLDETNKTNAKVEALHQYFEEAPEVDKIWAIALLSGKRPRRAVRSGELREWTAQQSQIPLWLLEETYHIVGDLAETVAKLLPAPTKVVQKSLGDWMEFLAGLPQMEQEQRKKAIIKAWDSLPEWERFVFNKMMMGGFRMGVSQKLMVRALARHTGKEENELAHRLMGDWQPHNTTYQELIVEKAPQAALSRPYPFCLAYPLEGNLESLGAPEQWVAEHKWDGIRGQMVTRKGTVALWSRGEELVTDRFPELKEAAGLLPGGVVLDGEILAYDEGEILPFQHLQKRLGRKNITKKMLENAPVVFRAYDLLEYKGLDWREKPFAERRKMLEELMKQLPKTDRLQLSGILPFESWNQLPAFRENARQMKSEGLMLKRADSAYEVGRKKGIWYKWKVEPLTIDAVLIYAMRGHGRRANLYTDYTFAVWKGQELLPFTKAYSGLTDKEFKQVDAFVKKNTLDKFGPVRSVKPELVFEIAFEGIQRSSRHKSGVALRFPRMKRWRHDKKATEANQYADLHVILQDFES